MTIAIAIRRAEPGDAESIATIHVASWQSTYRGSLSDEYLDSLSPGQRLPMWKGMLESDSSPMHVWVAEFRNEIVGFCSVAPPRSTTGANDDTLELHTIYLRPDCERRGFGSALLRHAEREMKSLGATSGLLWVLEENLGARHFYEASGWKLDDIEKVDEIRGQSVREVRYSKQLVADKG